MSAHRYVIENDSPSINNDTGSPELLSVKAVKVTFEVEEGTDINAPPEDLFSPLGSTTLEAGLTDENTIAVHSSSPQEITQKNKIPMDEAEPLLDSKLNNKFNGTLNTGDEEVTDRKEEGSEEKGKDGDQDMDPKPVSLAKLFSYATCMDWILMIIGVFFSILHGLSLPTMALILGQLINLFTGQEITQGLAPLAPVLPMTDNDTDCNGTLNSVYWGTPVFNLSAEFPEVKFNVTFPHCSYVISENSTLTTVIKMCHSNLTDCVNNQIFLETVNILVFAFLGIAVVVFICAFLMVALFQAADERQIKKLRLQFYKSILRQEIGWFDTHSTGSLASRITNDLDKIREGIGDKIALLFSWMTTFIGGFIVAFITDWRLSLVCLGIVPFLAAVVFFSANLTTALSSREQTQYAMAGSVAEEVISSIRTVVAFGGEKQALKRYEEKLKVAHLAGIKKGASVGLNLGLVFLLFFTFDAITFWFGGWLISQRFIEGGEVLIVLFAILLGAFAVGKAGPNVEALLTAAGSAGAVLQIINKESLIDPYSEEGEEPAEFDGAIEFKDVTFSYPARPDLTILDGFDLKIEAGKTYAFVGPSGCGKSTVIQLLQRFYDPNSGEVRLGGKDIRSLRVKWLRQHIGIVSQEPVLFDTTIAENIRYGKEDATDDEVTQAAENANAHDFISQLPDRYDTFVGEGGTQLSGGQKQRIAIARALLNNPKILLLDDATSALDTESESIVQQALDRARSGRTTIVIAHRLSTIQNADLIVSIEDGRVVEMGTHFELMDKEGLYCELVTAQSQGADFTPHLSSRRMTVVRRHTHTSGSLDTPSLEKQISSQKMPVVPDPEEEVIWSDEVEDIPEVPLWRVMKKNAPEWWIILIGFIAAAVHGAIFPSFAVFFGQILRVFTQPPELVLNSVHMWAALLIVVGFFSVIIIFLQGLCFSISGENLTSRLRSESFFTIMRQEMAWFDSKLNSSSELVIRLATDASKVQEASGMRLGSIVEVGVGMIAAIIIAFVYSWALALLVLPLIPIILIGGLLEVKVIAGSGGKSKKDLERAGKVAVDSISHIRTVAALGLEDVFFERFTKNVMVPYRKALKNVPLHGLTFGFSQCVMFLMFCIVFRFGAYQITLPEDNPAKAVFTEIVIVFAAVFFAATGAGQASAFLPEYTKAKISANKIFHLLDRKPLIDSYSKEGLKPESVTGDVSAHTVEFNYPARPDVQVLRKMDVSVKAGQTLALVGPSGCGKSTVVSLIQRFYDPLSGYLTVDGINITDLNIRWLREHIGIVSQEPVLFEASIADNIRYGANFKEVTEEEVIEAAKVANVHEFVSSLPQGYNTNVGTKGAQLLSRGQKQRIAIARALIRDPQILLLDEATSALDTESEKIVQEALDKAREGRTSIVIAHRLSTIYNADCIAVITDGKVAEMGTHRELLERKGIYYKLNSFQRKDRTEPTVGSGMISD